MMNTQLELGINNSRASLPAAIRQRRRVRAHWWFEQMRQVVDRAFDWQPAQMPSARQTWFKGGNLS